MAIQHFPHTLTYFPYRRNMASAFGGLGMCAIALLKSGVPKGARPTWGRFFGYFLWANKESDTTVKHIVLYNAVSARQSFISRRKSP